MTPETSTSPRSAAMSAAPSFRSDAPFELTEETDAFGHLSYVATLTHSVTRLRTNSTIGLFAQWGTGKTAILNTVATRVNEGGDAAAVVLDVWRYEEDTSLRREFMRGLGEQLHALGQLRSKFDYKHHVERLDADTVDFIPKLRYRKEELVPAGIAALIVAVTFGLVLFLLPVLGAGVTEIGAKKAAFVVASGLLTFLLTAMARIVRVEQIQVSRARLQDSDEFARSFEALLREGLKANRLVIGIDNLDRCSPQRVTELLATIKTFLEPAQTDKELVFVIAADDAALRRHLIAQEMAASGGAVRQSSRRQTGGATDGSVVDHVPQEVRDAVDDYLRKFFSGVLRLNDLLDDDVREFIQGEFAAFVAAHEYDGRVSHQLIELVATALKSNPRRIKQFINGLELRLQLLKERKNANRILIVPDVLMVAKLAIIEEQWPEKYALLKHDPRRLATWHDEVRSGDDPNADEPEDYAWDSFLRYTEPIRTDSLRAYIDHQQSAAERDLPQYREFIDTLEAGRAEHIGELFEIDEVAAAADQYRALVVVQLRHNLSRRWLGGATQIVRCAVEAEALEAVEAEVLGVALQVPDLRERLTDISFSALMPAAAKLDDSRFNQVAREAIGKFAVHDEAESRRALAKALVPLFDRLDEGSVEQLSAALRDETVRRDFSSYLPLAEARPELLPEATTTDALAALDTADTIGKDEAAYRVLMVLWRSSSKPDGPELLQFVNTVTNRLFALAERDPDEYGSVARQVAHDLATVDDVPGLTLSEPIDRFDAEWEDIPEALRPAAMTLLGSLFDLTEDEERARAGGFVDRFFSAQPASALSWFGKSRGDVGETLTELAKRHMANHLSGGSDTESEADEAVLELPKGRRRELIVDALGRAIDNERFARAGALLNTHAELLGEQAQGPIERMLELAEHEQDQDRPELLTAISSLDDAVITPDLAARQGKAIAEAAAHRHQGWREAIQRTRERPFGEDIAGAATLRVFQHITAEGQMVEAFLDQVDFVLDEQARLSPNQVEQLGTVLVQALTRVPADANDGPIAQALGRVEGVEPGLRANWAKEMIVKERQHPDIGEKKTILAAARDLAGHPTSNAFQAVEERLEELSDEGENERALAAEIRERR